MPILIFKSFAFPVLHFFIFYFSLSVLLWLEQHRMAFIGPSMAQHSTSELLRSFGNWRHTHVSAPPAPGTFFPGWLVKFPRTGSSNRGHHRTTILRIRKWKSKWIQFRWPFCGCSCCCCAAVTHLTPNALQTHLRVVDTLKVVEQIASVV